MFWKILNLEERYKNGHFLSVREEFKKEIFNETNQLAKKIETIIQNHTDNKVKENLKQTKHYVLKVSEILKEDKNFFDYELTDIEIPKYQFHKKLHKPEIAV